MQLVTVGTSGEEKKSDWGVFYEKISYFSKPKLCGR